jgi:hypothetical protein
MLRTLKTYVTPEGGRRAPETKAALQAWGASRNLFETDDPDIVAATMTKHR